LQGAILARMLSELQHIEAAIAALESQRALIGDAVVDTALAPLRDMRAALSSAEPTHQRTCEVVQRSRLVKAPEEASINHGFEGLSSHADGGQTLKQVTILFLDIVGSTTLSQKLDPEDIHAVIDGALARFTAIVLAHHGKVLQYAGDNLLAVFGADVALEDDAERAVHAGLALLAEGRALGRAVLQRHGHAGFDVRIGVHTGGVLLGGGVDAEGSIRSLSVNMAARMEQTAPVGAMRISGDTQRQVHGVFDVEARPPIEVKGVAEPVVTFLVLRARPRAFRVARRGIEGIATRMVGRDAELAQLQHAFRRVCGAGGLSVLAIVAEAGFGKSRLLDEFQAWAQAEGQARPFQRFQGRAHPQTQAQPYGLLRDILAWRLQMADGDSAAAAARQFEHAVAPLFLADEGQLAAQAHAHVLGHLIGLDFSDSPHLQGIRDDARQIRNRAFGTAAQLFRRVGAQAAAPVVLLLDDLHWADDESLAFLNHLFSAVRDMPMLVLALTRPALYERHADWPAAATVQRIDLGPLDVDASRRLADELLQRLPDIPQALRALITGGAEGNPFYMEELVKMLVDEGAISIDGERWTVHADKLLATRVPPTLTGVLQARLDSISPAEKLALQRAAVIGYVFWDQALAAIDAHAADALPAVQQRALIAPHPQAGFDGVREYAFSHHILQQVAYATVLKRLRRGYHGVAARWLAALTGARAKDFLGLAAEHFLKAGEPARACDYFTRSAEHAAARYAHEAVMSHVAQGLASMAADAAADSAVAPDDVSLACASLHWRLIDVRERTLGLLGRRVEQSVDIGTLAILAETLGDDRLRFEAAWRRSDIALRVADYRSMEVASQDALQLALQVGDSELRLRAQQRLSIALGNLSDLDAGKQMARAGLAEAHALGLRKLESLFLNVLSVTASMQGDPMLALGIDTEKLVIDRELGNPLVEATTVGNLGESWLQVGDFAQARYHLQEGLRLSHAVGDLAMQCTHLLNLSQLVVRHGEADEALVHAQAALDIALAVQNPESQARALWCRGRAELARSQHAAAAVAFERAHALARVDDSVNQHDAAAGIAQVALARGDVATALRALDGVLAHIEGGNTLDGTDGPRLIQLTCHRALAAAGDARASQMLRSAHEELQMSAASITQLGLQQSFLVNIPEHRDIVAAWRAVRQA